MTSLPQLVIPGIAMSEDDAFCEARRRWGNPAEIRIGSGGAFFVGVLFMVPTLPGEQGYPRSRESWTAHGVGTSWEAAFADADRTAHKRGGL